MRNLKDLLLAFLSSPIWAVLRYRLKQYERNCDIRMHAFIRKNDPHNANREDSKIEAIGEFIKLTEGLYRDVDNLDVDEALNVIENKKRR